MEHQRKGLILFGSHKDSAPKVSNPKYLETQRSRSPKNSSLEYTTKSASKSNQRPASYHCPIGEIRQLLPHRIGQAPALLGIDSFPQAPDQKLKAKDLHNFLGQGVVLYLRKNIIPNRIQMRLEQRVEGVLHAPVLADQLHLPQQGDFVEHRDFLVYFHFVLAGLEGQDEFVEFVGEEAGVLGHRAVDAVFDSGFEGKAEPLVEKVEAVDSLEVRGLLVQDGLEAEAHFELLLFQVLLHFDHDLHHSLACYVL